MNKAVSLLIVLALLCTLSGGLSLSAHAADTSGNTVILKPQGSATRAQVATILMRFILAYL